MPPWPSLSSPAGTGWPRGSEVGATIPDRLAESSALEWLRIVLQIFRPQRAAQNQPSETPFCLGLARHTKTREDPCCRPKQRKARFQHPRVAQFRPESSLFRTTAYIWRWQAPAARHLARRPGLYPNLVTPKAGGKSLEQFPTRDDIRPPPALPPAKNDHLALCS